MSESQLTLIFSNQLGKVAELRELLSQNIVITLLPRNGHFLHTAVDLHHVLVGKPTQNGPLIQKMAHLSHSAAFHTLENHLEISSLNQHDLRIASILQSLKRSFNELHLFYNRITISHKLPNLANKRQFYYKKLAHNWGIFINQQQLAYCRAFTHWQTTHTNSVSWQLSTQKGMQQHIPVKINKPKHQIQVTPPGTLRGKLSV